MLRAPGARRPHLWAAAGADGNELRGRGTLRRLIWQAGMAEIAQGDGCVRLIVLAFS
jgi:hypothetical protein